MSKKTMEQNSYLHVVLDGCLGDGWETLLSEAGWCARTHNHGEWDRVLQVVREYHPSSLARLWNAVVEWLNG